MSIKNIQGMSGMDKSNFLLLLEYFLNDAEIFIERYLGTKNENRAFDKFLELFRNLYKLDDSIFDKAVLNRITTLKEEFAGKQKEFAKRHETLLVKKLEIEGEVGVFSSLPFKKGGMYTDRNNTYIVIEKAFDTMVIEYDNGKQETVDLNKTIKGRIHQNIIDEKLDAVKEEKIIQHNDKIVRMILNANTDERYISLWVRNLKRKSHCYKCTDTVDISCPFCYICGWFKCVGCDSCGCGYKPRPATN